MSTRAFVPEIWSTNLLVALRKQLIFAGPSVSNRNYEGEIANAGDTVRITSIGRPAIGNYEPNVTVITPQALQAAQRTLVVDQAKYWAFEVDDVDARQQLGNFITESMSEAAYALADVVDQYVAAMYTEIPSANQIPAVT
ncbi:MAG TPA: P22 coat protein - protein 5 domain protein, partial [Asanoa sp.]|nr:P22 coat protein - protein 5 domain protein [Asanoa sp.]